MFYFNFYFLYIFDSFIPVLIRSGYFHPHYLTIYRIHIHNFLFCFCRYIEFIQGHLDDQEFGTIYWSLVASSLGT